MAQYGWTLCEADKFTMIPANRNSYLDFDIKITEHNRDKNACNLNNIDIFNTEGGKGLQIRRLRIFLNEFQITPSK